MKVCYLPDVLLDKLSFGLKVNTSGSENCEGYEYITQSATVRVKLEFLNQVFQMVMQTAQAEI